MPERGADYRFDLDIGKGEIAEKMLAEVLCGDNVHVTIESKRDFKVTKTGNVAVEQESRGKPSGINTSEADWWIFVLDGCDYRMEVFIGIRRSRLRKLLKKLELRGKLPVLPGGDNGTSLNALVERTALVNPLPSKDGQRKLPFTTA